MSTSKKATDDSWDSWYGFPVGDYGYAEQPVSSTPSEQESKQTGRGCICGQDSVTRVEDRTPNFHSPRCPVSKLTV